MGRIRIGEVEAFIDLMEAASGGGPASKTFQEDGLCQVSPVPRFSGGFPIAGIVVVVPSQRLMRMGIVISVGER